MPKRIQLKRTKGWRMPPNTVKVDRRTAHGNPWRIVDCGKYGWMVQDRTRNWYPSSRRVAQRFSVWMFRRWARTELGCRVLQIERLRGKNLACWCKPGEPCHADVLLELANAK